MTQIENLWLDEPVRLDPDRLVVLYAELGQIAAERYIAAAMEDLATNLVAVQLAAQAREPEKVERGAAEVERLARQVGMVLLARVARDLNVCAGRRDKLSQSAVLARLIRIADRSLCAVWDLQDMRG